MRRNTDYRDDVERIVDAYNSPNERDIEVPFRFFYDLYREQHKEVEKMSNKVKEAENLSEKLHSDFKSNHGQSTLLDENQTLGLREKVFQICTMLFDQQSQAGYNLSKLETGVRKLKREFTDHIKHYHYWENEQSINRLFEAGGHAEVTGIVQMFQKRNFDTQFSAAFGSKLSLGRDAEVSRTPGLGSASASKLRVAEECATPTLKDTLAQRR